jgi:hypothetical protein
MYKSLIALASALALIGFISTPAFAKEVESGGSQEITQDISAQIHVESESDNDVENALDDVTKGISEGDVHKSKTDAAIQGLRKAAKGDWRIGKEIEKLAQEQEDVHRVVAEKMTMVEYKSPVARFLFGSDFNTLGELRSELVTSENGIDILKKAQEKAIASSKGELETQIAALEAENAHARAFIDDQEGKFSLFGWLVKLL